MKPSTYSKIAQAVRRNAYTRNSGLVFLWRVAFLAALADILAESDKKFDKQRFLEECK